MGRFKVRLNCVDHYQAVPTSLDPPLWGKKPRPSQDAPRLPIIRVFGATETGQKVCAHIHGAFPYLYLEYDGSLDAESIQSYTQSLRLSIDHALAVSYRRNNYDGRAVYVAHVSLVKGVPFFGYHVGYKYFVKVYMLNPLHMTRLADLLHQGAIMKRVMQPYEGHLQYLLQWMCDFNLYGCAYIETDKPLFRNPIPEYLELDSSAHQWHDRTIPATGILPDNEFPRQSHCSLEVDICVQDIANREDVVGRPLHHSFVERFSQLAPDQKLVQSMAGLWRDETLRRKRRMGLSDPGSSPFPPEVLVSVSADPRNTEKGGWIHEDEFRDLINQLVADEQSKSNSTKLNFDTFVKPRPEGVQVQTTLASVEELFLDKVHQRLDAESKAANTSVPPPTQVVVDEATIIRLTSDNEVYASENEQIRKQDDASEGADALGHERVKDQTSIETSSSTPIQSTPRPRKRFLLNGSQSHKRRRVQADQRPTGSSHRSQTTMTESNGSQAAQLPNPPLGDRKAEQRQLEQEEPLRLSQSFGYQVVKNPQDPITLSRLSQGKRSDKPPGKEQMENNVHQASDLKAFEPEPTTPNTTTTKSFGRSSSLPTSASPSLPVLARDYCSSFPVEGEVLLLKSTPPTAQDVIASLEVESSVAVIYQDAHYSSAEDVPERSREYAGQEFRLESTTVPFLPDFDPNGLSAACQGQRAPIVLDKAKQDLYHQKRRWQTGLRIWEIDARPPTWKEVSVWEQMEHDTPQKNEPIPRKQVERPNGRNGMLSQIDGPTQKNKHGFKYSQKRASTSVRHETQYMSTMSLEVHVNSRHDLAPDPEQDEISAVFWCLKSDDDSVSDRDDGLRLGILLLSDDDDYMANRVKKQVNIEVAHESDELDLINHMVDIVREFDPDVLVGYEVHNSSWGYLIERARLKYEFDLPDELSRMKSQSHGRFGKDADRWGFTNTSTIRVTGRHTINIWRAMRAELNLLQYTMENVVFHLLHRRIPHFSFADLTKWYKSSTPRDLAKVLDYFISRAQLDLEILDANELIPRTSEQARLLGVDFYSVFSRGSQFKVESLMFRIAKPESFVLVSPSRKQVGSQNALECLPLVMEPRSAFYPSPLLVLDFQSLYPSVMIAYNYCYSTCLGRVVPWRGTNKLGFADFKRSPGLLELVKDHLNIAPNGLMYVRPEMRKSLLAKMLGEILETRVMVKSGMKADKDDRTLQQLLNNRQLALKLIANVTYGYTSASFSGRMPCSEIADSIVQTGRETLEKAIAYIHSISKWGAEVVYGDTDSLFVYLKGKTREQAFEIGNEIAKSITDMNPRPIKLKFEKVYHPCVLLAKKRYVGFKYESPSQTEPDFDAKGIETVRRDGTPAEQKIEERALKTLFRTADLSQVKEYFQEQCQKVMNGKFSVQDFCFAKEVKLGTYAERGPPPPGALIATKRMLRDPRMEPQYGERVPYVVIAGAPGARLFERCVEPERLLYDVHAELDAEYYISKNLIPPLERIFNLVGANVRAWYDEMPKVQRVRSVARAGKELTDPRTKKTMESYMATSFCLVCRAKLPPLGQGMEPSLPLCEECAQNEASSLLILRRRLMKAEKKKIDIDAVCRSCAGLAHGDEVSCDSRDCPVFYSRVKAGAKLDSALATVGSLVEELENAAVQKELEW